MTKILVCLSNSLNVDGEHKIGCFYEQFINSLKQAGNDILVFIPNNFNASISCSENQLKKHVKENPLRQEIEKFAPDLVISFNNANYHDILSITSCPIILWIADLVWLWNQKKLINDHIDRYIFFSLSSAFIGDIKRAFTKVKDFQIHVVPSASNLEAQNVLQDKNISFIGTNFIIFQNTIDIINTYSASFDLGKAFSMINENPFITEDELLANLDDVAFCKDLKTLKANYVCLLSGEKRINILNAVCDLGLHLYGVQWDKVTAILPSLGARYHRQIIYSAKENQDLYNSSKLCINIMHEQGRDGIPWRVQDIMACSGCLVSQKSKDIELLYAKYIKLPMFENQYEARELCQKLLNDESWRKDIVQVSNLINEEGGRWHHRFKQMEEILGISLLNHNNRGSIKVLKPIMSMLYRIRQKLPVKSRFSEIRTDIRYKIWKYLDKKIRSKGFIS